MKFDFGVLPLATFHNAKETEETLHALFEGGLHTVEIACRTDYAPDAIARAKRMFPQMTIGAGTVLSRAGALKMLDMGADFLVSPGFSEDIARLADRERIPYIPGCVTPTEIMRAGEFGIATVKFFPAERYGGIGTLRALAEPFPGAKFLPTGGITMETFCDYLALPCVEAVGGSFPLRGNIAENCAQIRARGRKA